MYGLIEKNIERVNLVPSDIQLKYDEDELFMQGEYRVGGIKLLPNRDCAKIIKIYCSGLETIEDSIIIERKFQSEKEREDRFIRILNWILNELRNTNIKMDTGEKEIEVAGGLILTSKMDNYIDRLDKGIEGTIPYVSYRKMMKDIVREACKHIELANVLFRPFIDILEFYRIDEQKKRFCLEMCNSIIDELFENGVAYLEKELIERYYKYLKITKQEERYKDYLIKTKAYNVEELRKLYKNGDMYQKGLAMLSSMLYCDDCLFIDYVNKYGTNKESEDILIKAVKLLNRIEPEKKVIDKLANSNFVSVRSAFAQTFTSFKMFNHNAYRYLSKVFTSDKNEEVRSSFVRGINSSHASIFYEFVLNESSDRVLAEVLFPEAPAYVFRKDIWIFVEKTQKPFIEKYLKAGRFEDVKRFIERGIFQDRELVELLMNHPDSRVRESIAKNCRISKEDKVELAGDNVVDVRLALARNRKLSDEVIEKFIEKEDIYGLTSFFATCFIQETSDIDDIYKYYEDKRVEKIMRKAEKVYQELLMKDNRTPSEETFVRDYGICREKDFFESNLFLTTLRGRVREIIEEDMRKENEERVRQISKWLSSSSV